MTSPQIIIEPLFEDVTFPERATAHSAGYDVRAYLAGRRVRVSDGGLVSEREVEDGRLTLPPDATALVPLGFKARLPPGYEAQVRIRSSMAFARGLILPNAPGTIDADYPDEWMVMMQNASRRDVVIAHGERIAQIVLGEYAVLEWTRGRVERSTERAGGFGSTGHR